MKRKLKGIVFDMDNTLLSSRIDYPAMKDETYRFLVRNEILPDGLALDRHTTSTIIEESLRTNKMTAELLNEMWEIPKKYEVLGLQGAALEPNAREMLGRLYGNLRIAIVTNNSVNAALIALEENNILKYFDLIIGREAMSSLKPAPDGYLRVLEEHIDQADEWLSVGDSWIDGVASISAGIKFIAYRSDEEKMKQRDVTPIAEISDLMELVRIIEDRGNDFNE